MLPDIDLAVQPNGWRAQKGSDIMIPVDPADMVHGSSGVVHI